MSAGDAPSEQSAQRARLAQARLALILLVAGVATMHGGAWLGVVDRDGLWVWTIVSVLGETDRWVPYDDGLAVAELWRLPSANIFRYPLGHLGMPVQLTRDATPFERLRQVLSGS